MHSANVTSEIPKPSRLFHVQPLGRGTAQIESMTGYVARLAAHHLVTPITLLHRELDWRESGKPEQVGQWKRHTEALRFSPSINGPLAGGKWSRLLGSLTRVQGLEACTIQGWAHLFPARGLLRSSRAWCPHCIAEDDEPYDRLLWSIIPVKACAKHRCRLVELCPCCSRSIPAIGARSVSGQCPACDAKLGSFATEPEPALEAEMGVSELMTNFMEVVAGEPILSCKRVGTPAEAIRSCMAAASLRSAAELSRLLDVSRITAWYWMNGRAEPSLGYTLRICYQFKISLADFLEGKVPSVVVPRERGEGVDRKRRARPRHIDEIELTQQIEGHRGRMSDHPPSLLRIARLVGHHPRVLRKHFPELCREISAVHKTYFVQRRLALKEQLKATFRQAITQSRNEVLLPQRADVVPFLAKPGVLRSAEAREVLEQLILNMEVDHAEVEGPKGVSKAQPD